MSVTLTIELPDELAQRLNRYAVRFRTEVKDVILTAAAQRADEYERFDKAGVLPVPAISPGQNEKQGESETFEELLADLYRFTADPADARDKFSKYDAMIQSDIE